MQQNTVLDHVHGGRSPLRFIALICSSSSTSSLLVMEAATQSVTGGCAEFLPELVPRLLLSRRLSLADTTSTFYSQCLIGVLLQSSSLRWNRNESPSNKRAQDMFLSFILAAKKQRDVIFIIVQLTRKSSRHVMKLLLFKLLSSWFDTMNMFPPRI